MPKFTLKLTLVEKIAFALLFLLLLWSRFFLLNRIPATMPHDEMVYAIQAKSFLLQGTTLDQSQSFWTLKPSHPMYAELPAQVMSLGFLLSNQPLLAVHFSAALMGVLLPFLMALLVWQIWQRLDLSKATWVVFVLSPLFWQMSRISYDPFYSLWFYVLGGVLLLSRRHYWQWLSLPVFFLGFFQYQGFKLLLLPWILFLLALYVAARMRKWSWVALWQEVKKLRWKWLVPIFSLALMLFYGLVLLPQSTAVSRLSSFIFADTELLSQIVNDERRLSLDNPFASVLSNKVTAIVLFMLNRLVGVFNLQTLLLLLEPNVSGFSVWTHGAFYWLEAALAFVGLAVLLVKQSTRLSGLILLAGILTLCLPALVNSGGEWYLLRSLFSYLLLTLAAAWGLLLLWRFKSWRWLLLGAYTLSVINFSYQYFYRYPIISLDWGNFDERILARYLTLTQEYNPEQKIVVYGPEPEYDFWSYLFYADQLNTDSANEIGAAMRAQPPFSSEGAYVLDNLTFSSFCAPSDIDLVAEYASPSAVAPLLIVRGNQKTCPVADRNYQSELWLQSRKMLPSLSISAVLDSGERLAVYGDRLCTDYANTFIHVQSLNQLNIEEQGLEQFCSLWIKNLHLVE